MAAPVDRSGAPLVSPGEMLAAVIETSDDAIVPVSAEGGVTAWGPTAERLFCVPAPEALGRPLDHLFAPHVRPGICSVYSRALAGERIIHFESEVVRGDGLPLPVWVSLCPVPDTGGAPWGVVAITRDITEQRLAQASLAEVEGRLQDAEALSHVGSWLWDRRTGTVQWSTEFHTIHGVDPFEFDGTLTSHLESIHPDDREAIGAQMEDSATSACLFEAEYRIVRPDGAVRVLRVRAHPSMGSDGTVVGLRGIGQDVTGPRPGYPGYSVAGDEGPHPGHDVPLGDG